MPLTPEQIERLRGRLMAELARLKSADDRTLAPLRQSDREVGDAMDAAETSLVEGDAADRSEQDRTTLAEVEQALGRIDAGTYGVSELSGEPIAFARLEAVPWARYTVREQEELERAAKDRAAP